MDRFTNPITHKTEARGIHLYRVAGDADERVQSEEYGSRCKTAGTAERSTILKREFVSCAWESADVVRIRVKEVDGEVTWMGRGEVGSRFEAGCMRGDGVRENESGGGC